MVEHNIEIEDSNSIKQAFRRISFHLWKEVDMVIEEMRQQGVIEESCSSWISPAMLVKKKDDSILYRF